MPEEIESRIEALEKAVEMQLKPLQDRVANMSNTYSVRMSVINKNHRQLEHNDEAVTNMINFMAVEFKRQVEEVRSEFQGKIDEIVSILNLGTHRGDIWINNGDVERRWKDPENIPAGFERGRLR